MHVFGPKTNVYFACRMQLLSCLAVDAVYSWKAVTTNVTFLAHYAKNGKKNPNFPILENGKVR